MRLSIVETGLDARDLTLGAINALQSGGRVILHTGQCGCAAWLSQNGIPFNTLDFVYERAADFDELITATAREIRSALRLSDVVYGVMDLRDASVAALLDEIPSVRLVGGGAQGALTAYAGGATVSVSASDWEKCDFHADENALIREIDTRALACEIKLRLMDAYPEDTKILFMDECGDVSRVSLSELDRRKRYNHRSCCFVPAQYRLEALEKFDFSHLTRIVARLRDSESGCAWAHAQTYASLADMLMHATRAASQAAADGDTAGLCEELGDLFALCAMLSRVAEEHGEFDARDCLTQACRVLLREEGAEGLTSVMDCEKTPRFSEKFSQYERRRDKKGV